MDHKAIKRFIPEHETDGILFSVTTKPPEEDDEAPLLMSFTHLLFLFPAVERKAQHEQVPCSSGSEYAFFLFQMTAVY